MFYPISDEKYSRPCAPSLDWTARKEGRGATAKEVVTGWGSGVTGCGWAAVATSPNWEATPPQKGYGVYRWEQLPRLYHISEPGYGDRS